MKYTKIIFILILVMAVVGAVVYFKKEPTEIPRDNADLYESDVNGVASSTDTTSDTRSGMTVIANSGKDIEIVVKDLYIPWDIAFLPEGGMLVTERDGTLLHIAPDRTRTEIVTDIGTHRGEGGLLGAVLHPDFENNRWLYLYFTAEADGGTENRVERYRFENDQLLDKKLIISGIEGALYHDGGRMEFGPDGLLYITVGDATDPQSAQNLDNLEGTILRVGEDGSIPSDNPFGTAIYSYGHRNPQGIAWDDVGRLWSTEHGRSGIQSGLDEINLIEKGGNYGWPASEGDTVKPDTIGPVRHSGASDTWAPASLIYHEGSLFFGGLMGEALYEAVLDGTQVVQLKEHLVGEFGRIRTVRMGPDGFFYITTSNRDGRGTPRTGDDVIVRVNPVVLE